MSVTEYKLFYSAKMKKDNEKIITYDLYLKEKQLPTSVLKVAEEVKKIKKQLSMQ